MSLPSFRKLSSSDERDSILSRLRKLERLATSSNEHEAALAAARYQEILFKYNLTEAEVGVEDDGNAYIREFTDQAGQLGWSTTLLNVVAKANFCKAISKTGQDRRQVAVIGKTHNIEVVLFLHEYLSRELKRLAEVGWQRQIALDAMAEMEGEYVPDRSKRVFTNSFLMGAVEMVAERLREQRRKDEDAAAASTAMVVRFDAELKQAVHGFYPVLRHRSNNYRLDCTGRAAGRQAGSSIGLVQGVRGGSVGRKLLT